MEVYTNSKKKGLDLNSINRDFKSLVEMPEEHIGIVFALSGSVVIQTKSCKTLLEEGGGLMIKRSSCFRMSAFKEDFNGLLCFLDMQGLSTILSSLPSYVTEPNQIRWIDELKIPSTESIQLFVKSLQLYHQNSFNLSKDWSDISQSKLKELFWLLYHSNIIRELNDFLYSIEKPERFVFDWLIEKHFKDNLTLSELAYLGGYSISTFKRKFETIYNCTPGKWILNRRLEEAFFLLQISNKTITEICYEVGFENPSHFIQAFKAKYGTTPKQLQSKLNVV